MAIVKYLEREFDYTKTSQIKVALKNGVARQKLQQVGQSFAVVGDAKRVPIDTRPSLEQTNVVVGEGHCAQAGDVVTVAYVGTLDDGTQFDASKSFDFVLGNGDVIKGWDQGVVGMAVGGKRTLVVPSHLGYGKRGSPPDIPPNATLHFTVTMKKIVTAEG